MYIKVSSLKASLVSLSVRNLYQTAYLLSIRNHKTVYTSSRLLVDFSEKKHLQYKQTLFTNGAVFFKTPLTPILPKLQGCSFFTNAAYKYSPNYVKPYLDLIRFQRTIGTWLLFFPGAWSITMAAQSGTLPDMKLLLLFGVGAFLMRSSGCIINDMWDRDFDKKVTRTASRPLAAGVLSQTQALVYLSGLLSCSLGVLLSLNWYSILLGASSMGLVVTYPLFKRFTYWPQLCLGATINWGALLGWSAAHGECDWMVCLPLYMAGISWTVIYDTIYAHQDKVDDALIGVKSTALLFGDDTKKMLSFFAVCMVTGLSVSGYNSEQLWPYYLSVLLVCSHLSWQIGTVNLSSPTDCSSKFASNKVIGFVLLFGILLSNLLKPHMQIEGTKKY